MAECPYCGKEYQSEGYYYDQHVESCEERPAEEEADNNPVVPAENAVDDRSPVYQN